MMASAGPPSGSSLLPLLESLEDGSAEQSEQTDAYLTIANRLSGEEGRQFLPAVEKHFSRLGKATLGHITSPNAELSQAALQALGFCLYHSHVVSGVPETLPSEILSALCSLVAKSTDKNTCTRALWVISKQSFPPDVVGKKVSSVLSTLESVWSREDVHSVVMEHEALNVIIRLLEQAPAQMGEGCVRWAKLVIPLVVHSASKVRLRAAAAMELGMPLLLHRQTEVAAIIEPMMSTKLIPELQKLFMAKNETNVLKLWPLFVKLLGKMLHRGGPFINSLLHLEELGFRSSSPPIKKIAFIAWKSLIDNFALNPDILCSSKRMKLLMQPLASIHVRTEALLLTKVEVWWYLCVQLRANLSPNFDMVSVPLLQCCIGSDSPLVPGTPSRAVSQNGAVTPGTPKTGGTPGFSSSANSSRLSLNSSGLSSSSFPSVQLIGLEMLLHYFLGPDVIATAAKNKLVLNLEPLTHPLLSGTSSFTKHAAVLTSNIREGFTNIGKEAPDALLSVIWSSLVRFVNLTIESVGSKKERQGSEVLTLMLQTLQTLVTSEALPADKVMILFEATVKGIPQRVLGSASYQVGKMDVLNGTPALFLILLLYNSSMLPAFIEDERFFQCLQTLVGCGLSGPTSPLAFGEAVLVAMGRTATTLQNKEQLWRMWSAMVTPLTDTITQSNEVNQGDALEHNFSAMHSALLFPATHLLRGTPLQQASQKSMLLTWSKLYKVFARCSALVATAEENICCEELCAKMAAAIDREALTVPSTLNAVSSILQVMVECVDFSPYTPQFQQKLKSPHTPVNWMRKRNKVLGNLSTFQSLLVQCLDVYLESPDAPCEATGLALVAILSTLFTNLVLSNTVQEALATLLKPITLLYTRAASNPGTFTLQLLGKLEKLLSEVLCCLQTRSSLAYDTELLTLLSPLLCVLFPHKNKHLRTSVTQFWNGTFANSVSLTYPEEIRPILNQVKQNTPIILPGFETFAVPDQFSGPYSSESSQLETNFSGMPVSSVGMRDSMLGKTPEMKDRSSIKTSKPVSTKLDFGSPKPSPKPPRRGVLEEEASVDFVFIPPETKERVLTEHQKEVKRTKRVDIPAMYNNLDASMDTTVFSQYTQSQEDSMDTLPTHEANEVTKDSPAKVPQEDMEKDEDIEVLTKDTQDFASPQAVENMTENHEQEVEQMIPESTDVSMEEDTKSYVEAEDFDSQPKEGTSPNVSGSSDLITGTPQKANSRRQSFITLEKYSEGMSASPSTASFTSTLIKTPNSQERSKPRTSSRGSRKSNSTSSQNSQSSQAEKTNSQCSVKDAPESPLRPKDATKCEPVRLTERLPSDTTEDEDVIPDTQTEAEGNESTNMASSSDEVQHSSQEEDSQPNLDDSQSSSPGGETRRSGRQRVRPKLPGEDPEEREEKYAPLKKRRSGEEPKSDSQKSSPVQTRPNTRSKNSAEEDNGKEGLRTRSRRDKGDSSQTNSLGRRSKKIKLYSNSEEFLGSPEPRRRSTRGFESASQTDTQSDQESQSKGRPVRPRKSPLDPKEDKETKKVVLPDKKESSQTASLEIVDQANKDDDQPKKDSQIITPSPQSGSKSQDLVEQMEQDSDALKTDSEMVITSPQIATTPETAGQSQEVVEQVEKDAEEPRDSDMVISSPQVPAEPIEKDGDKLERDSQKDISSPQVCTPSQTDSKSQESELVETTKEEKTDSPKVDSSQTNDDSQGRPRTAKKLVKESEVKDKLDTKEVTDDNLSQNDSQVMTPSDSQSLRRSRRSKTDSQDSSENKEPSGRQSRSNSQGSLPAAGQTEAKIVGRRSKAQEKQSKSSPISTPASSQSLDLTGSTESTKGRGKYVRRTSSQMLLATAESSGSESPEARKSAPMPKRRGKKPKASRQSPLALEPSKAEKINIDTVKDHSENTQTEDTQNVEDKITAEVEDSQLTQDLQDSESVKVTPNVEEQSNVQSQMEVEVDTVNKQTEAEDTKESETLSTSPLKDDQTQNDSTKTIMDNTPSQESDTGDMQTVEMVEPVEIVTEETQETLPSEPSILPDVDALVSPDEAIDKLQVSESSEEKVEDVCELVDNVTEEQNDNSDTNHQECPDSNVQELPLVPLENTSEECPSTSLEENQMESPNVPEEISKEEEEEESASIKEDISTNQEAEVSAVEVSAVDDITPLEENYKDGDTQILECQNEEKTDTANIENDEVFAPNLDAPLTDACDPSVLSESTSNDVLQGSPAKQKDLEALMGLDLGQSPSSSSSGGRTRGTWSPSASPSTSILKKGQKRPLEDDTPSPLVKSGEKFRRVSFANPIQHQEIADDIDRRSPAIRTSSPRRSKVSGQTGIPGPKYVTTPTKGLIFLSPRNLHSPGYKSSKKCLISEMGQEPRPVSKDCIYPSLVGCSTPVEAVLPQISSNMWARGFGQLVRARNIKTVGDLSALTPTEIKTLPIRSPKISNVKKALKIYEQQRKGRGVDELKSFDEMEMMTSEPGVHDEEDKTSVETLATALVDEPVLADGNPEQDIIPGIQTLDTSLGEQTPGGLLSDMEALTCRMTPLELSHCNSQQLVDIHDQLGGMMRKVVVEMQTRLTHTEGKP